MDHVSRAVEFVFLFTLAGGLLVLQAAIAATQDERKFDAAILRTLGASQKQLARRRSRNSCCWARLRALVAAAGATATGWALADRVFKIPFEANPMVLGLWASRRRDRGDARRLARHALDDAAAAARGDPPAHLARRLDAPATSRYEQLGGDRGVRALVDAFYDRMDLDEAFAGIRKLHPSSLDGLARQAVLVPVGLARRPAALRRAQGQSDAAGAAPAVRDRDVRTRPVDGVHEDGDARCGCAATAGRVARQRALRHRRLDAQSRRVTLRRRFYSGLNPDAFTIGPHFA